MFGDFLLLSRIKQTMLQIITILCVDSKDFKTGANKKTCITIVYVKYK